METHHHATLACAAALLTATWAQAATEDFESAAVSAYGVGAIAGTGMEIVSGNGWIADDNVTPGIGRFLDLASGWYAQTYDNNSNVGATAARSLATFDLLAGTTYQLTFDYSRQGFAGGNGPFDTSLKASLGSQSVTYYDVTGFYYGVNWQTGSVTWNQPVSEFGARVVFVASGPGGYSGMNIDDVSMVALAPVPEPATPALLAAGLAGIGWMARRRLRAGAGNGAGCANLG